MRICANWKKDLHVECTAQVESQALVSTDISAVNILERLREYADNVNIVKNPTPETALIDVNGILPQQN